MKLEELKNTSVGISKYPRKTSIIHLLVLFVIVLSLILVFLNLNVRVIKNREIEINKNYQKLPESLENKNVLPAISCPPVVANSNEPPSNGSFSLFTRNDWLNIEMKVVRADIIKDFTYEDRAPSDDRVWRKISDVALSPDETKMTYIDHEGNFVVFDFTTTSKNLILSKSRDERSDNPSNLRWSPDSRYIIFSVRAWEMISHHVFDTATEEMGDIPIPGFVLPPEVFERNGKNYILYSSPELELEFYRGEPGIFLSELDSVRTITFKNILDLSMTEKIGTNIVAAHYNKDQDNIVFESYKRSGEPGNYTDTKYRVTISVDGSGFTYDQI